MHNERLLFIDIAKGIGILLVVVGHISWGAYTSETHTVINIFHMPLFFYVSTLFFKRINFIELIIKKAKRLLVPFLLYGFLALMLYLYITPPSMDMYSQIVWFCLGMRSHGYMFSSTLWFLTSLFGAYILFSFLMKFIDKKRFILILFFLFGTVSIGGYSDYFDIILPLNLDVSLYMLPYCFGGYYSKRYLYIIPKREKLYMYLIISSSVLLLYFLCIKCLNFPSINIYDCKWGIYPFQYLSGMGGIIMLMSLSQLISMFKISVISRVLSWFGKNSIIIFIIHQAFIIHPLNCYHIYAENTFVNGILRFSIVILLSIIPIYVINKYFYWTIGSKKK